MAMDVGISFFARLLYPSMQGCCLLLASSHTTWSICGGTAATWRPADYWIKLARHKQHRINHDRRLRNDLQFEDARQSRGTAEQYGTHLQCSETCHTGSLLLRLKIYNFRLCVWRRAYCTSLAASGVRVPPPPHEHHRRHRQPGCHQEVRPYAAPRWRHG